MLEKSSKIRFDQTLRSLYIIVHDSLCDRLSCILTLPDHLLPLHHHLYNSNI
ncbi:hypothetical protein PN471_01570 [Aphanizomenon sp. CS-733/32]|uniref:hypothetical protein n=1 Tax=Aphanizomenon sp. CS-733/32 TaxID=3021715 RepID=UPI00232D977D|nr:hypothetical protein [Aphanizomenon sp. CS-733/32]MDB9307365.1 hypothetical protein [Aphanizomenon sp. CS-733/32]